MKLLFGSPITLCSMLLLNLTLFTIIFFVCREKYLVSWINDLKFTISSNNLRQLAVFVMLSIQHVKKLDETFVWLVHYSLLNVNIKLNFVYYHFVCLSFGFIRFFNIFSSTAYFLYIICEMLSPATSSRLLNSMECDLVYNLDSLG